MTTKTEAAARYREVADMPIHPVSRQIDGVSLKPVRKASSGLTKREHFAIQVMGGFAADPGTLGADIDALAVAAVCWADALIAALSQGEGQ